MKFIKDTFQVLKDTTCQLESKAGRFYLNHGIYSFLCRHYLSFDLLVTRGLVRLLNIF